MYKPLALAATLVVATITIGTTLNAPLPTATASTPPVTHQVTTAPPATLMVTVQATQRATAVDVAIGQALMAITAIRQAQAAQVAADARAEAQREAEAVTSYTSTTRPTTTTTTYTAPSGNSIWSCIIAHESGGNPSAVNSSSGAGGLFQFLPSSWQAYGGSGLPEDAPVSEQWAIAEHAQAVSGWYPWVGDGCTPVG